MMRTCAGLLAAAILIAPAPVDAQASQTDLAERVMAWLRDAVAPALPYPESDAEGVLPRDESSTSPWMVRPHAPGDRSIEVIANPLNLANQQRATRAMAEILASLGSAQRRADAQYERAVAEAKRTGRSQDVDGVTLADEGVAGARIDAESHVTIDVEFNQPAYRYPVRSSIAPAPSRTIAIPGATAVIAVPSNVYRNEEPPGEERYCSAESILFLGRFRAAGVDRLAATSFVVTASGGVSETEMGLRSFVVRLRGNDALIAQILMTADWARLIDELQ